MINASALGRIGILVTSDSPRNAMRNRAVRLKEYIDHLRISKGRRLNLNNLVLLSCQQLINSKEYFKWRQLNKEKTWKDWVEMRSLHHPQ